ncbi:hypothetical protein [Salinarimonas ramus]|nr:hypothetical protein [Salinarimonas ramus]
MDMPRRDSSILRLVPHEDAAALGWMPAASAATREHNSGAAPAGFADHQAPARRVPAIQAEIAPEPIRRAIARVIAADASLEEAAFTCDRRPRNHPALRGRAGRVSIAGPDAPVRATVALEPELRMLGANYRDGWHGIAPDAFSRGVLARTLAEKALLVAAPALPQARREAVAEHLAYEAAGPHWAFRALMGVRAAHGDLLAGRRPGERSLLLGVAGLAMHEALQPALASGAMTQRRPIEAGMETCGAFFAWLAVPGTFETHPSYPEAFRTFLEETFGLSPVTARAAASRFVSRMAHGNATLARSILAEAQAAAPRAP